MSELDPVVRLLVVQGVLQAPFLVVSVVALRLAIARRARHPQVSFWATLGFAAFAAEILCRIASSLVVAARTGPRASAEGALDFAHFMMVWNGLAYVLLLVAVISFARAIFISRDRSGYGEQPIATDGHG
jgi:hypothetical protein